MSVHNEIRLYSTHQSDCTVQLRHVNRLSLRDPSYAQVFVVPFDKASGVAKLGHTGARVLAARGCAPPVQALLKV